MGKPAFTQRDVEKAIAACQARGIAVGRVEIDRSTGRIVVLPAGATAGQGDGQEDQLDGELQAWREEHGGG